VHSFSVTLELLAPLLPEDDELPLSAELLEAPLLEDVPKSDELEPLFSLLPEDDELPLTTELLEPLKPDELEPLFSLLLEED
jgi:hypothetical protein